MLFKCEPFDTFLAAVGADGGGRVSLKCVSREKKKLVWNSQLELKPASYSGPCGEWTAALALL